MPKLTDKEKVLEYLLGQKRDGQGKAYLGTNSYATIPRIAPEHFIEQLRALECDELVVCAYIGLASPKSACYVTVNPSALTYFEDKKETKRRKIFDGWIDFIKFIIPTGIAILAYINSLRG